MAQTGSRNCTQTGSNNNFATTIDAISVAVPMFLGPVFIGDGVYANLIRRFLNPEISRWRRIQDAGSSYKL